MSFKLHCKEILQKVIMNIISKIIHKKAINYQQKKIK